MLLRERFPIFRDKIYLNSCSQGALSSDVMRAYDAYLQDWQTLGSPWDLWVEKGETVRQTFAALINAHPEEIAVSTSVSAALSTLASALDFSGERNRIVVSDFEFPTVAQIWHAQEARGAEVVHVPVAGNSIPPEQFADAIDDRTKLVAITHVCYRNGVRLDIPAIVEIAHQKGALVVLDSYQALGTFPIDVKALQVDFLVGGVLKYLLASAGVAFMVVNRDLISTLNPSSTGWFAQQDIFAMDIYAHTPSLSARRFESGTPPIPCLYAAIAGMQLVRSVGADKIALHLGELTGALKEGAIQRGFNLVTPVQSERHGALICLRSHNADLLVKRLAVDGIITSSRDGNLRISPHIYNNLADINRLLDCLTKTRELLV